MTRRNLKRGFTLLELMIAISLMLIIMLMLRSMFVNAQTLYLTAAKRVDVYSQARASLDIMEQDLLRLQSGQEDYHTINVRSLMPSNLEDHENARSYTGYSPLDDWSETQDAQSLKIKEFLSFTGRNTWWDREEEKYVTGDALVVYYLRRRLPIDGEQYAGGYLVRRIIPIRSNADIVRIGQGLADPSPMYPHEDELASFVYGVRVFVDDQAAFQLGDRFGSWTFNTMPEASQESPNAEWMWYEGSPGARPVPTKQGGVAIQLQKPPREDRVEFGGVWRTNTSTDRDFLSSRWNYPSVVMIDLMMIDRRFERYDSRGGSGTYRSFSRAVQLPVAGPMFRLDDTDMNLVR